MYAGPVERLMTRYLQGRTVNLTGKPFDEVIAQLQAKSPSSCGQPAITACRTDGSRENTGKKKLKPPLDLHAVVLVGYDSNHLYVNDPLTGKKAHPVDRQLLIDSWNTLGKQALSYR